MDFTLLIYLFGLFLCLLHGWCFGKVKSMRLWIQTTTRLACLQRSTRRRRVLARLRSRRITYSFESCLRSSSGRLTSVSVKTDSC